MPIENLGKMELGRTIEAAKVVNALLLSRMKNGGLAKDLLSDKRLELQIRKFISDLPPNALLHAYPIRPEMHSLVEDAIKKWPNPMTDSIRPLDGLRPVAPAQVLDLIGATLTTAPPPEILITKQLEAQGGYWIEALALDLEGISGTAIGVSPTYGLSSIVVQEFDSPNLPLRTNLKAHFAVEEGEYSAHVRVTNSRGQATTKPWYFTAIGPEQASSDAPAPSKYGAEIDALAKKGNLSSLQVSQLYDGYGAVKNGNWSVTWFGSIEVGLAPSECQKLLIFCGVAATMTGAAGILALMKGATFYSLLIVLAVLLDIAFVAGVMEDCVRKNKYGTLGFNVPTGIFYAYN